MNQDNNQQITENNPDAMLEANYDCTNCGENVIVKEAVKNRPIPDLKGYTELGLECPHCQHWEHSSFGSPKLDRLREQIRGAAAEIQALANTSFPSQQRIERTSAAYRRARKQFSTEFKRVNKVMRKKFKVKSPRKRRLESRIPLNGNGA